MNERIAQWIFMKYDAGEFYQQYIDTLQFWLKSGNNNRHVT
jgi:hypothetical protein